MSDATLLVFPQAPADRLRLALRRLEVALADQSAAVGGFRVAIGALRGSVAALDAGLADYCRKLDLAAEDAGQAHAAARRLSETAARLH